MGFLLSVICCGRPIELDKPHILVLLLKPGFLLFKEQVALTLNQPGSAKSVNYWGPFSFGLAFTRCKLTSPGRWPMCNRAQRFREFGQNGTAILLYLDSARPTGNPPTPALYAARDEKLIGIRLAPHRTEDHGPAGPLQRSGGL